MITARHRFHGYNGLKTVYKSGLTVRSSHASLKFSWRDERKAYRSAVVVSRKVHKSAVVRNRIRRRIFEIIRNLEPTLPGGFDMVFLIYSDEIATQTAVQLQTTITGLINKAIAQKPHTTRPEGML